MAAYPSPVRWRDDTGGWELRCERCAAKGEACFWPLADEFWDRRRMSRCRACEKERQRDQKRARYQSDPNYRARTLAAVRQHRKENPAKDRARTQAAWAALKSDPVAHDEQKQRRLVVDEAYRRRQRRLAYQREWMRRWRAGEGVEGIAEWLGADATTSSGDTRRSEPSTPPSPPPV